jgi:hypothetical protein
VAAAADGNGSGDLERIEIELLRADPLPDPPLQRRRRVPAEVEAVAPLDCLEQEVQLEPLELRVLRRSFFDPAHLYSHTRMSETSWSVSTGLGT